MRHSDLLERYTTDDFEQVFFGDLKKSGEADTEVEQRTYDAIEKFIKYATPENKAVAKSFLNGLKDIAKFYPEDLIPSADVAYRGTHLTKEDYDEFYEVMANMKNPPEWVTVDRHFMYNPKSNIQSWTTKHEIAAIFAAKGGFYKDAYMRRSFAMSLSRKYPAIIQADVNDEFILNTKITSLVNNALNQTNEYEIMRVSNDPIKSKIIVHKSWLEDSNMYGYSGPQDTELALVYQVMQNPSKVAELENPTEPIQLAAVRKNGIMVRYFKNPSEEVQKSAVAQTGHALEYLKNPSEEVKAHAIEHHPYAIKYVKHPSEELQFLAIEKDIGMMEYIANPTEDVQMVAVQKHLPVIRYIRNPTPKVKRYVEKIRGSSE